MRAPGVLLSTVIACAIGAGLGYYQADTTRQREIEQLQKERDLGLVREQELRTQLQDALAARAAFAKEAQHLQQELTERLRRLEDAAAKLSTPPTPSPPIGAEETTPAEPQSEESPAQPVE